MGRGSSWYPTLLLERHRRGRERREGQQRIGERKVREREEKRGEEYRAMTSFIRSLLYSCSKYILIEYFLCTRQWMRNMMITLIKSSPCLIVHQATIN